MNQDVNVQHETSASTKRVFKFHNVNREKILGNRKTKREESRKNYLISSLSIEEEYRKKKAQLIFDQFVPIKQKSPETGPERLQTSADSDRRGLRLVNIASLQEPSELSPDPDHLPPEVEESPLDLPLDLSNKPGAGEEAPLDLSLSTKSEEREAGGNSKDSHQHNSNNQPLQFLLLKNISSNTFFNLIPSSNSEQRFIYGNSLLPKVPNIHGKDIKREALQENEISQSKKSKNPVQMVLSEGRVVQVLPSKPVQEERISGGERSSAPSRYPVEGLTKDQNQNEMKPQGRKNKFPEMMVKTNETVTKNGDLFCTFKNVKQMKMLREQSRRTQKKSRRS